MKNIFSNFKSNILYEWRYTILVTILSILVHVVFFGHPSSVVFDEVHIGKYIIWHLQHSYFFDVHPPLGRLIFAFFAYLINYGDIVVDFGKIGNLLPNWIILLRIVPIIFGILLSPIVYGILRNLNINKKLAFLGGVLICLENSTIVQSRFLLTDSFILFFGFLSLLLYLIYRNHINIKYSYLVFYLAVICAISAFSIKWIGLSFLGMIVFFELINHYLDYGKIFSVKLFKCMIIIGLLFVSIYSAIFAIHLRVLPNTGNGDPYMSKEFQKNLIGSQYENDNSIIAKKDFPHKFLELNAEMISANNRLVYKHDYSSLWYTWPMMSRPIYYWNSSDDLNIVNEIGKKSHIYFIGNPVLYWFGIISILILFIISLLNIRKIKKEYISIFILIGFISNFLPFIFIGRVMFLYHYAPALVFSIMALVLCIDKIKNLNTQNIVYTSTIILASFLFLFFSPLTYGLPLTDIELGYRVWFSSWR